MLFCPTCGNLLLIEKNVATFRYFCKTCPYIFNINQTIKNVQKFTDKEQDAILGGKEAWANVAKTDAVCPACEHNKAYFKDHTTNLVDLVVLDLGEDQLLAQTQGVVAATVESIGIDALEVTQSGECEVEQSVHELVHLVATQSNLCADLHALTELEVSDGLLCVGGNCLLTGDQSQVRDHALDDLRVFLCVTRADVDNDLVDLGDLHNALVVVLVLEGGYDLGLVVISQSCHCLILLSQISWPQCAHTRTFLPSTTLL